MKFLKKYRVYFVSIILIVVSLVSIVITLYIYSQNKTQFQTYSKKNAEELKHSKILGEIFDLNTSSDNKPTKKNTRSERYGLKKTQISEKKSESTLESHENKEKTQNNILKLEYQLNNIDEQYGFDIPAVKIFWGSKLIAQLHKDTRGSAKTIFLDLAFFEVENFDITMLQHDVVSTYDNINIPQFFINKVSLISSDELKIEEFSITNNQVEVLTKKFGSVEVLVETDSIEYHQPVLVRIQKDSELIHPVKNHKYLDRFVYSQLTDDNSNIFQFLFEENEILHTIDLFVCVIKNKCTQFKLET